MRPKRVAADKALGRIKKYALEERKERMRQILEERNHEERRSESQAMPHSAKSLDTVWFKGEFQNKFMMRLQREKEAKEWSHEEAMSYLGPTICAWLTARPMEKLDTATAWRWGLLHMQELEVRHSNQLPPAVDWRIQRLKLGDGKGGFEDESFYASSEEKGDGIDVFYRIFLCTVRSENIGQHKIPKETEVRPQPDGTLIITLGAESLEAKLNKFDAWARRHKGRIFIIGPGARGPSERAKRFYAVRERKSFCRTRGENCALAGIINALLILGLQDYAIDIATVKRLPVVRDFTDLSRWMREFMPGFQLYGGRKHRLKLSDLDVPTGRAYLLRLIGSKKADHIVVLDAEKRLLYDSEEDYPMVYTSESVAACVGDDEELNEIREIRMLSKTRKDQ